MPGQGDSHQDSTIPPSARESSSPRRERAVHAFRHGRVRATSLFSLSWIGGVTMNEPWVLMSEIEV